MAQSLSARKRIRQNISHRARNRWRKIQFRTAIKHYDETILHGSVDDASTQLRSLYKLLDQVSAAGTIHRNTASRYKSRLSAKLNKTSMAIPAQGRTQT